MIPNELKGRFVYHFTSINNLESIISDGLLSTNLKVEKGINHQDIANDGIQERRKTMNVTCGPKGVVHDYVPFYFAKRTPMLLSIVKSKNIDQIDIIYLAIPIEKLVARNVVFSDASANTALPPNFFDKTKHLNVLDWNTIDSWSWTYHEDDDRHKKMAEMLVHKKIEITDISHIVVWNKNFKNHVKDVLKENGIDGPKVVTDYHLHFKHHYFNDFGTPKRKRKSIVTGPRSLRLLVRESIEAIYEYEQDSPTFDDLESMVEGIDNDFCCIKELNDIEGLETKNPMHKEDVGKHSRTVVELVKRDENFDNYSEREKNILILSAYFHDIGKGPKSRWKNGIQEVDDDHPRKSLLMLKRILNEEVGGLSRRDLRRIHMLVVYDDLIGDISANGRDKCQLFKIVKNRIDVDLLISLGKADMGAIKKEWVTDNSERIEELRQEAYEYLAGKA
ncbi:MAG: hypothetical protein COA59_00300 [Colwellia sp.]|jgi:hypothetical protein|nr:MAG: hypothetical protein COA59_00300 [Colwellia sp.]